MNSYRPVKIVIIGGVAAGMSAASRARRNDPRAEITVVQKEEQVSYGACGLPYFIAGKIPEAKNLIARTSDQFKSQNINILTGHEALYFEHHKKIVYCHRLRDGQRINLPYDRLVIATGARPKNIAVPGTHLKNVFVVRNYFEGLQLEKFLKESKPAHAVIIGGGYVGLEMAEAFGQLKIKTTLIEQSANLLPGIDTEISEKILTELQSKECTVYLNTQIKELTGPEAIEYVAINNNRIIKADCVLVSVGISPNVEFAKSSGVYLGKSGAIAVNAKMETNLHNVFAAGDCAEVKNLVTNRNEYIPLGTTANKQGRVAGNNASGIFARFRGVVGTSAVKVFDAHIARTGLSSQRTKELGIAFETVLINAETRAHYSACKKDIMIKLIFKKPGGLLLGAQIFGYEGVAKRIDIFATALHQKMTVFDIAELDLSYAPPFAPVWDPVIVAANLAIKKLLKS